MAAHADQKPASPVSGAPKPPVAERVKRWWRAIDWRQTTIAYLFLAPALFVITLFVFWPIIRGLPLAFTNYSVIGETEWVGLDNFRMILKDDSFWNALKNTLLYVLVVPFIQLGAIGLAVLVNRPLKGVGFFRTAYYIPVVTSAIAAGIAWRWLYDYKGIINAPLMNWGIIQKPIYFLSDPKLALWSIMAMTAWKGVGYYMVIYLGGLQSIPKELEEAAQIDGAGKLGVMRHIIIPLLKPFVLLATLMSIMGALRVFEEVMGMTGGGADTNVVALYSYQRAFQHFEFGYGAAVSWIMALIIWAFSMLTFRLNKGGLKPE
jgi:putative chitobiose transport system permease protein